MFSPVIVSTILVSAMLIPTVVISMSVFATITVSAAAIVHSTAHDAHQRQCKYGSGDLEVTSKSSSLLPAWKGVKEAQPEIHATCCWVK